MEFRKMVTITLYARQQKRHRCIEQSFGLCGRGSGRDDLGEWHWNMYNIIYETNCQSRFDTGSLGLVHWDDPEGGILVFWMLISKSTLSLSSFTFIKRLFSSSSLSATRVVSSAYLRLLIFLPAILIPACVSSQKTNQTDHMGHIFV